MRRTFAAFFLAMACGALSVLAQTEYCFKNDGLKLQQNVSFTITGNKIAGTFESDCYDESTSAETFDFTGTRAGKLLTIKFSGKPPYELPPGTKKIVWKLAMNALEIPMYGKNYVTNKRSVYTAKFEPCKNN